MGVHKTKRSLPSILKFAIGWPLSIVALFFVARIIFSQQKDLVFSIEQPNIVLLLSGLFSLFLFYFTRSFVWKVILKEFGYDVPLKTASFLWEIAELRRFVPGKLWPFLSRATLFSKINVPTKIVIKALIIETESFLLAAFIISALGAYFYVNSLLPHVLYSFLVPIFLFLTVATILFIDSSLLTRFMKGRFLSKLALIFPKFSPYKNAIILSASISYLFLFGFGTYLTVASIVFVSPEFFLEISVFFVFALLVGYLSFIVPMGLGVRESVMIVGLSQFIPLSVAGVASIFARIISILSELLFLLFTYIWKRTKNKFVAFLENFIVLRKQEVILGFSITIYILYFTATTFLRYDNFYTGRFDLGNMDQTVWNTIHGRIFELTDPNGTNIVSRLAFHADFILILLSPFYLLWEDPRMLLLIQTVVLAIGAIFVYKIANNIIKNKNLSLVFAVSYLLNPALQYTNLYDFHPVTLATTFLLGAFYFLRKSRYLLFLLFGVLAAITKEQVWIIIAIFGLYIFFFKPTRHSGDQAKPETPESPSFKALRDSGQARMTARKIFGLIITLVSVFIFYYLIWHVIPNALGSEHFAISYYSNFGDSPTDILKNVFVSPHKLLETIIQKDQLSYLSQLFLPLGFTSVLSPFLLIFSLPDLFINLLSNKPQLHQIYYQYSATITPFIFISSIFATANLKKWLASLRSGFPKIPNYAYAYCLLLTTLYSAYAFGPLPFSKSPNIDMFTKPQKNKVAIENFISKIPAKYSVSATNSVGSHLAHRQELYNVPHNVLLSISDADYIVFLLDDHFAQPSLKSQYEMVEKIKNDKNYVEVLRIDNFIVFKKLVK